MNKALNEIRDQNIGRLKELQDSCLLDKERMYEYSYGDHDEFLFNRQVGYRDGYFSGFEDGVSATENHVDLRSMYVGFGLAVATALIALFVLK